MNRNKMKLLTIILAAVLCAVCLSGCEQTVKTPTSVNQNTSTNYKVTLLFEVDGIKVYRFYDGRAVYFTNANGKTSYDYTTTHRVGNHTHSTTHHVESVNTHDCPCHKYHPELLNEK